MTAVLKYIWIYLNVIARSSFRFFLQSSPAHCQVAPAVSSPPSSLPCRCILSGGCVAWVPVPRLPLWPVHCFGLCLSGNLWETSARPACKQSMSLPFLQKQGGSSSVLPICAMFLKSHFCQAFQCALCNHRACPKHLHCWGLGGFPCILY